MTEPHYITKPDITKGSKPQPLLRWQTILAVVIGLALFSLALTVIWTSINTVSYNAFISQFGQLSWTFISIAMFFALASFALASVEDAAEAPEDQNASFLKRFTTAFIANSVTNITDMGSLSGLSVKSRVFSAWSLTPIDIARVNLVTQRSSIMSAIVLLIATLLLNFSHINTVQNFPKGLISAFCAALCGFAIWYWLRGAAVSKDNPLSSKTFIISAILNAAKWITAAATFYFCLHGSSESSFSYVLAVFILAHSIGRLSGLPGGIGVFEAACFLLLPHSAPADLAVALVSYRSIYFLAPLIISALIIGVSKGRPISEEIGRKGTQVLDVFELMAPPLYAVLIFLTGTIMLISAATPDRAGTIPFFGNPIGLLVVELSHLFASVIASLLLIIAMGLRRRLQNAWVLAVLFLIVGSILTLLKGADPKGAVILLLLGFTLYASKDAFYRKGYIRHIPLNLPRLSLIVAAIGFAIWVGFYSYLDEPYSSTLWWEFGSNGGVSRFLRAFVFIGTVISLYAFWRFLQPAPILKAPALNDDDFVKIKQVLAEAENPGSESNLAYMGDKQFLFSQSGKSFIMYGIKGRNWVAMGNPVGLASEQKELIWAFRHLADQWDAWPCFYAVRGDALNDFVDAGIALQKIGELALIPLANFSMEGKIRSELRNSKSRAIREGCSFEIIYPAENDPEMDMIETVSKNWLAKHQGKEKRFSLGRFDRAVLAQQPIAIVRREGNIIAFANLWETADKTELSVDLMRYEDVKINGLMDYLFVEIMLWAKEQGYAQFGLGMAPLAGLEGDRLAPFMTKLGALIFEHGGRFYGFKGLRAFKQKFNPEWEAVYLAAPSQVTMPIALGSLALLSGGGILGLVQK